jgi:hypothetical protein
MQRGKVRRKWGMRKNFKAAVRISSHCNLGCVSWCIVPQVQNAFSLVSFLLLLRAICDTIVSIRLHSTYRLWYDLAQDCRSWLSPDYPKQLKPLSSLLMAPSWISSKGMRWALVLPLHALSVFILDRSDGPMFHHKLWSGR